MGRGEEKNALILLKSLAIFKLRLAFVLKLTLFQGLNQFHMNCFSTVLNVKKKAHEGNL